MYQTEVQLLRFRCREPGFATHGLRQSSVMVRNRTFCPQATAKILWAVHSFCVLRFVARL